MAMILRTACLFYSERFHQMERAWQGLEQSRLLFSVLREIGSELIDIHGQMITVY